MYSASEKSLKSVNKSDADQVLDDSDNKNKENWAYLFMLICLKN